VITLREFSRKISLGHRAMDSHAKTPVTSVSSYDTCSLSEIINSYSVDNKFAQSVVTEFLMQLCFIFTEFK